MANINYIASAGTGKTYNLIKNVIEKITKENIELKNLLILTFTEKAAAELKEKIAESIKEKISDKNTDLKDKIKLHKQLLFIDSGYIGTFHSVFYRFLRKYPEITKIDLSSQIIDEEEIKDFLYISFEEWIKEDFEKDKDIWLEIANFLEANPKEIKKIFFDLYKNRTKIKISDSNTDLNYQKEKINTQKKELLALEEEVIKQYKENQKFFKKEAEEKIKTVFNQLKRKNLSKLKKGENLVNKKKEKEVPDLYSFFEYFCHKVNNLRNYVRDYNAKLILKKFRDFKEYFQEKKQKEQILDFTDILLKTEELIKNEKVRKQLKDKFKYIFIDEFQDTDMIQAKIIKQISNNNIFVFGDPKQCIYTWRNANLKVYFEFLEENNFEDIVLNTNYRSDKCIVDFHNRLISIKDYLKHIDEKYKVEVNHNKSFENSYIKHFILNTEDKEIQAKLTIKIIQDLIKEGQKYEDIMILFLNNDDIREFKKILDQYNIPNIITADENLFDSEEIKLILNILKYIEYPENRLNLLKILKSPLILADDKTIYEKNLNISNKNLEIINQIISQKNSLTLQQIIDKIFEETDLIEIFSIIDENSIENFNIFKKIYKQKSLEGYSLRDFILYLETSTYPKGNENDKNAVKLFTIHKSKGLESPVIIMPLIDHKPYQIRLGEELYIKKEIPLLNLTKQGAVSKKLKKYKKTLKEEIKNENERLFYVATTRAKEKLIFISGTQNRENSFKNILEKVSNIEKETIDIENILLEKNEDEEQSLKDIEKQLKEIEKKEKQREKIYEKALKQQPFTSVSKIMEEEKEEVVKTSVNQEIATYTGILTHLILENLDFKNFSEKDINKLIQEKQNIIPNKIKKQVVENVKTILERFENSNLHNELKNAEILFKELPFSLYEDGKIIDGRIDIIYKKDGKIIVMDFKTNKYETEEEKQKIIKMYETQKNYYLKAVQKFITKEEVIFKLGLLWKGEVV
ncbi:UvrD-helicase domain-containing protein [Hydrogenothermus marinus]|uniref:DNA 3'-5' helicase n=1 Tax=Hydrogenothermus marinus TaxID=133270 RepID=A0A3M0BR11_9AQUI|nr:UvrD-helicase domain-containing protein [Hydrogenothermus marinus]RMA97268.1 DNA helicase/exodeoxyribonuclease V subunit A [Hydrogenothermus marinus]